MQSCVHSFFLFFLPDRPTHLHEKEGDAKRNILWGWPSLKKLSLNDMKIITDACVIIKQLN